MIEYDYDLIQQHAIAHIDSVIENETQFGSDNENREDYLSRYEELEFDEDSDMSPSEILDEELETYFKVHTEELSDEIFQLRYELQLEIRSLIRNKIFVSEEQEKLLKSNSDLNLQVGTITELATKILRLDRCFFNDGYHSVQLELEEFKWLKNLGFKVKFDEETKMSSYVLAIAFIPLERALDKHDSI